MTKEKRSREVDQAIDVLLKSGSDEEAIFGKGGIIKELSKRLLERALKAEMESHLGYKKYGRGDISDNARNGSYQKKLITEDGAIDIEVPRDRKGIFEPEIIKKRQSRISGFDEKIISLYAKGMSISDIKLQMLSLIHI